MRLPPSLTTIARVSLALIVFSLLFAGSASSQSRPDPGYARLVVITNFESTEVQINNVSYPYEWVYGDRNGLLIPAGIPFELVVSASPEQRRRFRLNLRDGETRVVVVDIENMGQAPAQPQTRVTTRPRAEQPAEEGEEEATVGYLGVSSSPRGIVYVDGESTGRRTPARRIELEPGRYQVQVFYEEAEEMSEVKHVLIRAGTNNNVFFRRRATP